MGAHNLPDSLRKSLFPEYRLHPNFYPELCVEMEGKEDLRRHIGYGYQGNKEVIEEMDLKNIAIL